MSGPKHRTYLVTVLTWPVRDDCVRSFTARGLAAARVGRIDPTGVISLRSGDRSQPVVDLAAAPATGLRRPSSA
ncbi:hypothetical protein Ais01nite_05610 [Asanoa ishikariensis]|uniref:Uncharacterized protein n=1 Tax=Asanoa ishikariensis TaxID=137265 RepID=A0A1H3TG99_9ACTN|nr:hypothetical protein [Asanoa ishikariensis]GIF62526.1 hypothetical protein Ais01nite_05610 [Asanoa ishikariensis]SDZ49007.1 hypothetical protein SAMN05421684_5672 [Asanoa ishikariensis]